MNTLEKIQILSDSAQYDLCDYVNHQTNSSPNLPGIYNSTISSGCKIPIFKVLMTNQCCNDCKYCLNNSKRNFTRIELSPEELTKVFLNYYQQKYVHGLFLSSGISRDIESSMGKVVEVARLLRLEQGYQGYIHLKIIPGTSRDLIKRAMSLADRVSVNIEAATPSGLQEISSTKDFQGDIIRRLTWISNIHKKDPHKAPSGQSTQFIVGANDENDEDILKRVKWLYDKFNIKRSYFSTFQSLEDTPLEKRSSADPVRSSRLYQADALLNSYNFKLKELVFEEDGDLNLQEDPKYLAAQNMDIFPLELNQAKYKNLIRVPGIGPISARRIITLRKKQALEKVEELKKMGVVVERAQPFIKIQGTYQSSLDNFF